MLLFLLLDETPVSWPGEAERMKQKLGENI